MPIVNTLELSTIHVTDKTQELLYEMVHDNVCEINKHGVYSLDYGWFIVLPENRYNINDLDEIVKYARSKKCRYIVIDVDADICNDLPVFWREPNDQNNQG